MEDLDEEVILLEEKDPLDIGECTGQSPNSNFESGIENIIFLDDSDATIDTNQHQQVYDVVDLTPDANTKHNKQDPSSQVLYRVGHLNFTPSRNLYEFSNEPGPNIAVTSPTIAPQNQKICKIASVMSGATANSNKTGPQVLYRVDESNLNLQSLGQSFVPVINLDPQMVLNAHQEPKICEISNITSGENANKQITNLAGPEILYKVTENNGGLNLIPLGDSFEYRNILDQKIALEKVCDITTSGVSAEVNKNGTNPPLLYLVNGRISEFPFNTPQEICTVENIPLGAKKQPRIQLNKNGKFNEKVAVHTPQIPKICEISNITSVTNEQLNKKRTRTGHSLSNDIGATTKVTIPKTEKILVEDIENDIPVNTYFICKDSGVVIENIEEPVKDKIKKSQQNTAQTTQNSACANQININPIEIVDSPCVSPINRTSGQTIQNSLNCEPLQLAAGNLNIALNNPINQNPALIAQPLYGGNGVILSTPFASVYPYPILPAVFPQGSIPSVSNNNVALDNVISPEANQNSRAMNKATKTMDGIIYCCSLCSFKSKEMKLMESHSCIPKPKVVTNPSRTAMKSKPKHAIQRKKPVKQPCSKCGNIIDVTMMDIHCCIEKSPHYCEFCKIFRFNRNTLILHLEKRHFFFNKRKIKQCLDCYTHFSDIQDLINHQLETLHARSKNSVRGFCGYCGVAYPPENQEFHTRDHVKEYLEKYKKLKYNETHKLFECIHCKIAVADIEEFRKHICIDEADPSKCYHCFKDLSSPVLKCDSSECGFMYHLKCVQDYTREHSNVALNTSNWFCVICKMKAGEWLQSISDTKFHLDFAVEECDKEMKRRKIMNKEIQKIKKEKQDIKTEFSRIQSFISSAKSQRINNVVVRTVCNIVDNFISAGVD